MKENNASESGISVAVAKSSVFVVCDRSRGSNVVKNGRKEARKKEVVVDASRRRNSRDQQKASSGQREKEVIGASMVSCSHI